MGSTRRLVLTWLMLMGLSAAMAITADVRSGTGLGVAGLAATGVVAAAKSYLILRDYLALRACRGALRGFTAAVALVLAIVVASFLAVAA
jgi:hypothetical protein